MKQILFSLSLVILITVMFSCGSKDSQGNSATPGTESSQGDVTWYSFNEGVKLAHKLKRPVVIDFFADWCKWCKVMEKETFSDPAVAKKLANEYIPIRINTDKEDGQTIKYKNHELNKREFSMMLGVQGLPTLVFMDKDANLITKIPGFINKDVFIPLLNYMKDECYKKNISFTDYQEGKKPCDKK